MEFASPATTRLALPTREIITQRLASMPPIEQLMTADDLEKQAANAKLALKPAAVLLLVVNHAEGPTVVFTQRTAHLSDHGGQISFPGGRCDEGDCSPDATALREAEEEIGVSPERIEILGRMPEYRTVTGYSVTPVVGWIEPPVDYRPDPREVEAVFEVPLAFLLDAANHRHETAMFKGRLRQYWAVPYGDRFIWGATAGMLMTFHRILLTGTNDRTILSP